MIFRNRGDGLRQIFIMKYYLIVGTYLQFLRITFHSLGCDENGQPQEMSKADFNSSCPYSGPITDGNIAAFYDFHEIMPESEEIRYEPGAELLFRCIDIGKSFLMQKIVQKYRTFIKNSNTVHVPLITVVTIRK